MFRCSQNTNYIICFVFPIMLDIMLCVYYITTDSPTLDHGIRIVIDFASSAQYRRGRTLQPVQQINSLFNTRLRLGQRRSDWNSVELPLCHCICSHWHANYDIRDQNYLLCQHYASQTNLPIMPQNVHVPITRYTGRSPPHTLLWYTGRSPPTHSSLVHRSIPPTHSSLVHRSIPPTHSSLHTCTVQRLPPASLCIFMYLPHTNYLNIEWACT